MTLNLLEQQEIQLIKLNY